MNPSTWIKDCRHTAVNILNEEKSAAVCIIGAGLSGLTLAYYLSNTSSDFLLIEADHIGAGASGRNTCKLSAQHGLIYSKLEKTHGLKTAKDYYIANMEAIDSVKAIIQEHQIDCGFEYCDTMLYTQDPENIKALKDEYQTCQRLEIDCSFQESCNLPFTIAAGIVFHHQARFDPMRYMEGLYQILKNRGISIFEHSASDNIIEHEDEIIIMCNGFRIHAQKAVLTTQFPFYDKHQFYFTRSYPSMSSITAFPVDKNYSLTSAAIRYEKPLFSVNCIETKNGKYLISGGNEHKTGQGSPEDLSYIERTRRHFHVKEASSTWTTQDYMTFDHIPFIGRLQKNNDRLLFASGFNKWGNTTSNIAGKLLCALVLNQSSPYEQLYNPHRSTALMNKNFLKENANVAKEYILSHITPSTIQTPNPGEGCIIEIDRHPYGAYRNAQGELFVIDAVCPHLGCILKFNAQDKTWDCPCHGSRFSFQGEIIKGPATQKLHTLEQSNNTIDPHIL